MAANKEIETFMQLERKERAAARSARTSHERDLHLMKAERHADHAWSLGEAHDGPYVPSGLWDGIDRAVPAAG